MRQPEDNKTVDIEDIMIWPDGEWCYRYELPEFMRVRSGDYNVLYFGDLDWNKISHSAFHLD